MLEFRELRLSDKPWVDELLAISDFRGCDYCFANNLAWRRLNDTKVTRYKDFYISASGIGEDFYFTFPAGGGDYADVLSEMKAYASANSLPFRVSSVSDEMIPLFTEIYGDDIRISTDPGNYDYVYNAADLMELKGKKYHQKLTPPVPDDKPGRKRRDGALSISQVIRLAAERHVSYGEMVCILEKEGKA